MDWWTEVRGAFGTFLDQYGLLAAFVFLLIEEAGVPVPVPGDFVMILLGMQAEGPWELFVAILVMEIATIIGATALYAVARIGGRGLVYRYGRYIRLTPERLDKAEEWLLRHGAVAVFVGRMLPGLRILTAVACGVFCIPLRVYVPAMGLGALIYIVLYTFAGYFLGQQVLGFFERLHLPLGLLGSLLPLGVIIFWTFRARQSLRRRGASTLEASHHRQFRAGAIAGFLATIGSSLFMNVVLNLAGNLAFHAPGTLVQQTASRLAFALAREAHPALLFVALPAFLAVGTLWGAVYGGWGEEHLSGLPDWLKGTLFSIVPLTVSCVVVMPAIGLGWFGVGATGAVALVGEILRHATYGALLGLIYPVLLAWRTVRVLPHTPAEIAPVAPSP